MQNEMMKRCNCPHHKVVPLLVVLFAAAFLLRNLGVLDEQTVDIAWPILVGLGGLMHLTEGACKCC